MDIINNISLGIDAGGTYTDVVLMDNNKKVLQFSKSLTSYPNPLYGIKNALNNLNKNLLANVTSVFLSTTLSTNTILENTGYPVGLIFIGKYQLPKNIPSTYYCIVNGGHDINGDELEELDLNSVMKFASKVKENVFAFAVSSLFSTRNSAHELEVKELLSNQFNLPVVCGHELSSDLGAYERAITAYINAQLIPITQIFINSIKTEMRERNIKSNLSIVKCDGSVVDVEGALKKPIETIFSGPAASLIGASYLSNLSSAIVVDIGGTSTDIAKIINKVPVLSSSGSCIGGWKTQIKAIDMETSAIGGDSHVYSIFNSNGTIELKVSHLKAIPLCIASSLYPDMLNKLNLIKKIPKKYMNEYISPLIFYVRIEHLDKGLSLIEKKHFFAIKLNSPTSLEEIKEYLGGMPLSNVLKLLLCKRLIKIISFTPTDASHVLNESTQWNNTASIIGSKFISNLVQLDHISFSKKVKELVTKKIVRSVIKYLLKEIDDKTINKVISCENNITYKILLPIVLIGGPSKLYDMEIKKYIDVDIYCPSYSNVGNAIGAIVGKKMKIVELLITNFKKCNKNNDELKIDYFVFYNGKRNIFDNYDYAYKYAYTLGYNEVINYFSNFNINDFDIQFIKDESKNKFSKNDKIEIKLKFIGIEQ